MIQNSVDMPSWSLGKLTKLNGRRRSGGGGWVGGGRWDKSHEYKIKITSFPLNVLKKKISQPLIFLTARLATLTATAGPP